MSKKGINGALHRPLKDGLQFNKLFPASSCKSTFLGKGDTYKTIDLIEQSIKKYHQQTNKVAPLLKKDTLNETVKAIYNFWYSHIQYKADGADQNLKSPACLWSSKFGDCKSFSIAAGCTLSNLGIKYYVRKIRQASIAPSQFTHVYIVVPHNQKTANLKNGYSVIDATKHTNTEASFIGEPKDLLMENLTHNGLNAEVPQAAALGVRRAVTQADRNRLNEAFLFFEKLNIDPTNLGAAKRAATALLDKNILPVFATTRNGLVIGKTLYPFSNGEPRKFNSPTKLAMQLSNLQNIGGLNADGGEDGGWLNDQEMGDEIEALGNTITSSGWFDSTIGAILGNGWQFSCWGSSNSPKLSEEQVTVDFAAYMQQSGLQNNVNTNSVNAFVRPMIAYLKHREFGITNNDLAQCTRDGNQAGYSAMGAAYGEVLDTLDRLLKENGGSLDLVRTDTVSNYNITVPSGYHDGYLSAHDGIAIPVPIYSVKPPVRPVVIPPGTGVGSSGGGAPKPNNTGGGTPKPNTGGGTPKPNTGSGSLPSRPVPGATLGSDPYVHLRPKPKASTASTGKLFGFGILAAIAYNYYDKSKKQQPKRLKS